MVQGNQFLKTPDELPNPDKPEPNRSLAKTQRRQEAKENSKIYLCGLCGFVRIFFIIKCKECAIMG
jgi:hypothetical protein